MVPRDSVLPGALEPRKGDEIDAGHEREAGGRVPKRAGSCHDVQRALRASGQGARGAGSGF